jgi:hypothetical protein
MTKLDLREIAHQLTENVSNVHCYLFGATVVFVHYESIKDSELIREAFNLLAHDQLPSLEDLKDCVDNQGQDIDTCDAAQETPWMGTDLLNYREGEMSNYDMFIKYVDNAGHTYFSWDVDGKVED